MNKLILGTLAVSFLAVITASQGYSADCTGPWSVMPNYKKSMGSPCQALGLDSHKGTCQPGQQFETLCDSTTEGRYRLCSGNNPCININIPPKNQCRNWDYNYNMSCPPGFINVDCKDSCETRL